MDDDYSPENARRELTADQEGRADAVIAAAWPDMSRAAIQRLIAAGLVLVDGVPVRKSATVERGATISVTLPKRQPAVAFAAVPLEILFEDDDLVVVAKPAGLVVHDTPSHRSPSVVDWFLERYPELAGAFGADRPAIVHRLDRDTTGVLVLAKRPAAQNRLSQAFELREAEKCYVALCSGVPQQPVGIVDAPVGRDPVDRTKMAILTRGRSAQTAYEVVASGADRALIEAHPKTGRTHQIRVHLAAIGAPVAGDGTYGRKAASRQLLHAWRLRVPHPSGGWLEVTAPVPDDFQEAAERWGFGREVIRYCERLPARRIDD